MSTTRWLVKFGYDGAGYYGWARQPGLRTVEGEIGRGIVRRGIASSGAAARMEVGSRTDRGVSAVGNALTLSSSFGPAALLRALNGTAPDIAFFAATEVPETFRVRTAIRRVYRYFEPAGNCDFDVWQKNARLFSGRIDVRSLGRGLPPGAPVWRSVESVTVTRVAGGAMVELRAPSFVWGMVRKIVAALREVETGRLSVERLGRAVRGEVRLTLPMAEPEPLVLWEVEFGLPWEYVWAGPNRHQLAWQQSARRGLWVQQKLLDSISAAGLPLPE